MVAVPHPIDLSVKPEVTAFFDQPTNTVSYVVKDPGSRACVVIDSVMDLDYAAGRIAHRSASDLTVRSRAGSLSDARAIWRASTAP